MEKEQLTINPDDMWDYIRVKGDYGEEDVKVGSAGLTMQDIADYIKIKEESSYSMEELIAGFCLGDLTTLPEEFSLELLKPLSNYYVFKVENPKLKDIGKDYIGNRLREILGNEGYLGRLTEVNDMMNRVLAKHLHRDILQRPYGVRTMYDGKNKMNQLFKVLELNYEESEIPEIEFRLKYQFKEHFVAEFSDKDGRFNIPYDYLDKLDYNDWSVG